MKTKLKEMFDMQDALNKQIMKEKGLKEINIDDLNLALIDEIGELTHELKPTWCWWKINVGEVDNDKVLEELVDCLHFAMTKRLMIDSVDEEKASHILDFSWRLFSSTETVSELVVKASSIRNPLTPLLAVGFKLGYSFEDMYDEYIKKNKVNYERLKNGY